MRLAAILVLTTGAALADPAEVVNVQAAEQPGGWRFDVTIVHPDTGWDHYADGWRIEDAEGNELGLRVLHHPHVEEQPFTRSLSGVVIPDGTTTVFVRARDNLDGWDEARTEVALSE